jgi:hypothetical protein
MHVLISTDQTREISASPGANVKASKTIKVQNPRVGLVLLSDTAAKEKAIMTRLILSALSGTIFALAAILTTVVCFIGKIAFNTFYNSRKCDWGWQTEIDGVRVFLMHFPSRGAAAIRVKELTEVKRAGGAV